MDDMAFACRYGRETHKVCTMCGAFIYSDDTHFIRGYDEYICLDCWERVIEEENEEEEEDEQGIRD